MLNAATPVPVAAHLSESNPDNEFERSIAVTALLSCAIEECLFVPEAEGVAFQGVKSSLNRLHSVHAQILGVILTKFKHRQVGYGERQR